MRGRSEPGPLTNRYSRLRTPRSPRNPKAPTTNGNTSFGDRSTQPRLQPFDLVTAIEITLEDWSRGLNRRSPEIA